jgi:hypothetical protein
VTTGKEKLDGFGMPFTIVEPVDVTTGPLDGFGMPPEDLGATVVLYGCAPEPAPWIIPPEWPVFPPPDATPPVIPPIVTTPKPDPRCVMKIEVDGVVVFMMDLDEDQRRRVMAAVAEGLK